MKTLIDPSQEAFATGSLIVVIGKLLAKTK